MPGKCVYCGTDTKTKVTFTNASGVRFEYYSCMKGKCANKSIDGMFESNRKKDPPIEEGLPFEIPDDIKASFA